MNKTRPAYSDSAVWFTAAECARKTQLTVRALRVYERHGLIAPRRTEKNWRLYGAREIERLNEIIILKQLGLPLSRIAQLLAKQAVDLAGILSLQAAMLAGQRERLDRGLTMLAGLRSRIEKTGRLALDELIHLAQENTMSQRTEDATAWKLYEQARPRTAIRLRPALLREYKGHYRVGDGPSQALVISIKPAGSLLEMQYVGWPAIELAPEGKDKFFCERTPFQEQMPIQVVFERDRTGLVCGLVMHQHGFEEPAPRISRQEAAASAKALATRIANKTPFPNSEATVRKLIMDSLAGTVDDTVINSHTGGGRIFRDQIRMAKKSQARFGGLKSLVFRGVALDGADVYDVTFQHGQQQWQEQWRFLLGADGKIHTLLIVPNP